MELLHGLPHAVVLRLFLPPACTLPLPAFSQVHRGAKGQEGKESLSHYSGWLGQGGCPSWAAQSHASPMPSCHPAQGCPGCSSSCLWSCLGLILHLRDATLEEKMGSADLTGLEYQLWQLVREDTHPTWDSPECCIGVPEHPQLLCLLLRLSPTRSRGSSMPG